MKVLYNYLVTGVKLSPVLELLQWEGEAYSDKQAVYFFHREYGYKNIRDIHPRRGIAVVDKHQLELSIG